MIEYFIFELGCSSNEKSVKTRGKQQAYTHVVKSMWNQALKQSYGEKASLEHASWRHRKWSSLVPPYYSLAVPFLKVPFVTDKILGNQKRLLFMYSLP